MRLWRGEKLTQKRVVRVSNLGYLKRLGVIFNQNDPVRFFPTGYYERLNTTQFIQPSHGIVFHSRAHAPALLINYNNKKEEK